MGELKGANKANKAGGENQCLTILIVFGGVKAAEESSSIRDWHGLRSLPVPIAGCCCRVEKRAKSQASAREVPLTPDMFLARLQRQSSLARQPPLALTIGNLKDVIFYYLLVKYLLKRWRHLVVHGPVQTVVDGWRWLSLVRSLCISSHLYVFSSRLMQQVVLLVMRLPSTRAKVEAEIGKARQDIITKLIPQGPNVTRHISLPSQGQSAQWVAEEMERMDAESENTGLWRQGKLSGAVYRTSTSLRGAQSDTLTRRRRRYGNGYRGSLQTVLRFKPVTPGCVPRYSLLPLLLVYVSSPYSCS